MDRRLRSWRNKIYRMIKMPVMRMMENPSPSPIDLSVPKPNSNQPRILWDIQNAERQPFCPNNQNYYRNPQLLSTVLNVVHQPGFYPGYFPPQFSNMQGNPSRQTEMNPTDKTLTPETPPISDSPKSVTNCLSPSPKSPDESDNKNSQIKNVKSTIKKEFDSSERRFSEGSTASTISSCCEDANNNERNTIPKPSSPRTIGDFYSEGKLGKSPKKSRRRSQNSDSQCINSDQDGVQFPKRELVSPELTRLGPSPTSSFSSETDICDSTNRARVARPFKAITTGTIMDQLGANGPLGDFETFRQNILSRVNTCNKSTNQNMRRTGNSANPHATDPTYWEKRKRNNEAAKRSRDARRRKEDEIAIRCAYLEQERLIMVQEIKMLRKLLEDHRQQNNIRFHPYLE